jgi:hypothetical protein
MVMNKEQPVAPISPATPSPSPSPERDELPVVDDPHAFVSFVTKLVGDKWDDNADYRLVGYTQSGEEIELLEDISPLGMPDLVSGKHIYLSSCANDDSATIYSLEYSSHSVHPPVVSRADIDQCGFQGTIFQEQAYFSVVTCTDPHPDAYCGGGFYEYFQLDLNTGVRSAPLTFDFMDSSRDESGVRIFSTEDALFIERSLDRSSRTNIYTLEPEGWSTAIICEDCRMELALAHALVYYKDSPTRGGTYWEYDSQIAHHEIIGTDIEMSLNPAPVPMGQGYVYFSYIEGDEEHYSGHEMFYTARAGATPKFLRVVSFDYGHLTNALPRSRTTVMLWSDHTDTLSVQVFDLRGRIIESYDIEHGHYPEFLYPRLVSP